MTAWLIVDTRTGAALSLPRFATRQEAEEWLARLLSGLATDEARGIFAHGAAYPARPR